MLSQNTLFRTNLNLMEKMFLRHNSLRICFHRCNSESSASNLRALHQTSGVPRPALLSLVRGHSWRRPVGTISWRCTRNCSSERLSFHRRLTCPTSITLLAPSPRNCAEYHGLWKTKCMKLDEMESGGILEKIESSPTEDSLVVAKSDGDILLCLDSRY